MPAEIIVTADCASLFGIYSVPGSKGSTWEVQLGGESWANCKCPSFTFFKGPREDRTCKHLEKVWNGICKWNIQWSEGNPNPEFRPVGYTDSNIVPGEKCPACGGPMIAVRRAV